MTEKLSARSRRNLRGVHPDLVTVVEDAVKDAPFEILVVEGLRTLAKQREYVKTGASRTMNSRHLHGCAVDLCAIVDSKAKWGKPYNTAIADLMKAAAQEHDVSLQWGPDMWDGWDSPHFQLHPSDYPAQDTSWKTETPAQRLASRTKKVVKKAPWSLSTAAATVLAWFVGWAEWALSFGMGIVTKLAEVGPLKSMLIEAGANPKAITFSLITLATTIAASKILKPDEAP